MAPILKSVFLEENFSQVCSWGSKRYQVSIGCGSNGLASNMHHRAAQFSFRPGDYLPLHFGLNFRYPSYIYIRACCIIYICSLYHSVHKFTINNPNLCIIGLEIFNWKYCYDKSGHLLWPSEESSESPTLCSPELHHAVIWTNDDQFTDEYMHHQGTDSLPHKTSYCKISQSLELTRSGVKMLLSRWNLSGA